VRAGFGAQAVAFSVAEDHTHETHDDGRTPVDTSPIIEKLQIFVK
jgi:hypothetical protein